MYAIPNDDFDELSCRESQELYIQPCIYCGMPADTVDHVPPRHMRAQLQELQLLAVYEREVPACRECNCTLGSRPLLTITERRDYMKDFIRRRYKSVLRMKDFTEEELLQFGESLRGMLRRNLSMKYIVQQRLRWPSCQ